MTPTEAGSRILLMLSEQHDLLQRVGELANVQARVLSEDESEQLVAILQQRAMILQKAVALSGEIAQAVDRLGHGDPQQTLIAQRRKAVSDLAESIARIDQEHSRSLVQRRDELARTLAGMTNSRHAASAYSHPTVNVSPGYQDRRG